LNEKKNPNTAIDAMIAEEIMGWSVIQAGGEEWFDKAIERGVRFPAFAYWPEGGTALYKDADQLVDTPPFTPTSVIADAILVADKMKENGYVFVIRGDDWKKGTGWDVRVFHPDYKDGKEEIAMDVHHNNLAEPIAKASLKSVRTLRKGK
jgi:hypothetical protein